MAFEDLFAVGNSFVNSPVPNRTPSDTKASSLIHTLTTANLYVYLYVYSRNFSIAESQYVIYKISNNELLGNKLIPRYF